MSDSRAYRYPGVRPFNIEDKEIFFGREKDTSALFKLIMIERTVILFGKSGYGKSSLINAGILPKLEDAGTSERFRYFPIIVRIGQVSGVNESPLDKVKAKLNEQLKDQEQWNFLDSYPNTDSLWFQFKRKQSKTHKKFILVFDQFEEFFTYGAKEQELFNWQLAELLYTDIPQAVREQIDNNANINQDEQLSLLTTKFDIKILFSIRSDRLSLLHSLKEALPGILRSRFEVKGLTLEQAQVAIQAPALLENGKFVTHAFRYDDNSIRIILEELSKLPVNKAATEDQVEDLKTIEAFHLQIICQACESKIEEKLNAGEIDEEINEEDLPHFKNLYEEYYTRQIDKLPQHLREKAQKILEEHLIYEGEEGEEHRRLSVDRNSLRTQLSKLNVRENLLDLMEDAFLIRREPNTVGGSSYEIAHDTIIEPVLKIKQQREIKSSVLREVKSKWVKFSPVLLSIITIICLLIYHHRNIYFAWQIQFHDKNKPHIRLRQELLSSIDKLKVDVLQSIKNAKISDSDKSMDPWVFSQMVTAMDKDLEAAMIEKYIRYSSPKLKRSSCCWAESSRVYSYKEYKGNSWIVSTINSLNLKDSFPCDLDSFIWHTHLDNGAWSTLSVRKSDTKYSSTYATCHALRALHNSKKDGRNIKHMSEILDAIEGGEVWLKSHMADTAKSLWADYPVNREGFISSSLSGLAIHTLNVLGVATPQMNKNWLSSLTSQSAAGIDRKEENNYFFIGKEKYEDVRHVIIPWQIIATVDAYKHGSFKQKFKACKWLDDVIANIDDKQIKDIDMYAKAEILIALRVLGDPEYSFK